LQKSLIFRSFAVVLKEPHPNNIDARLKMDFFRAIKAFVLVELKTGDMHTDYDNSASRIFAAPFRQRLSDDRGLGIIKPVRLRF